MTKIEQEPTRRPKKSRIPRFKTIQEEAEFWDTHSTTEFEDEFAEVSDVKFRVRRSRVNRALTVRVDDQTLSKLTDQANQQGIGPSTMVRMWILEHLREGDKSPST